MIVKTKYANKSQGHSHLLQPITLKTAVKNKSVQKAQASQISRIPRTLVLGSSHKKSVVNLSKIPSYAGEIERRFIQSQLKDYTFPRNCNTILSDDEEDMKDLINIGNTVYDLNDQNKIKQTIYRFKIRTEGDEMTTSSLPQYAINNNSSGVGVHKQNFRMQLLTKKGMNNYSVDLKRNENNLRQKTHQDESEQQSGDNENIPKRFQIKQNHQPSNTLSRLNNTINYRKQDKGFSPYIFRKQQQ